MLRTEKKQPVYRSVFIESGVIYFMQQFYMQQFYIQDFQWHW